MHIVLQLSVPNKLSLQSTKDEPTGALFTMPVSPIHPPHQSGSRQIIIHNTPNIWFQLKFPNIDSQILDHYHILTYTTLVSSSVKSSVKSLSKLFFCGSLGSIFACLNVYFLPLFSNARPSLSLRIIKFHIGLLVQMCVREDQNLDGAIPCQVSARHNPNNF